MTPWQNERWATTPTNDGRNFAPAHRWAVVEARPLCFGGRGAGDIHPCGECFGNVGACSALQIVSFADEPIRCFSEALERAWKQVVVLAHEVGWQREFVHELRQRIATLEAENAALRSMLGICRKCKIGGMMCGICGHRIESEERGCARGDA